MIKVKADIEKRAMPNYPCIMIAGDDEIVLLTEPKTGTIIKSKDVNRIGYYSRTWATHQFTPWYGSVTLTQES